MELNINKRVEGLQEKIPEMKGTLETVQFLRQQAESPDDGDGDGEDDLDSEAGDSQIPKGSLKTTFSLNDTLYAHATVDTSNLKEVYLWLGANVMVAYPLAEAETMLSGRLEAAQKKLQECEEDSDFLREQITTMEVATARVYNWDVVERRKEKAEDEEGSSKKGSKGDD